MSNYADYVIKWNTKIDLEAITKWLRYSGLLFNVSKTEICLFHRTDLRSIKITINNITLKSTPRIKVLRVIFDSKLNWSQQVANTFKKCKNGSQCNQANQKILFHDRNQNLTNVKLLLNSLL